MSARDARPTTLASWEAWLYSLTSLRRTVTAVGLSRPVSRVQYDLLSPVSPQALPQLEAQWYILRPCPEWKHRSENAGILNSLRGTLAKILHSHGLVEALLAARHQEGATYMGGMDARHHL